jgi:hypothetical protein
MLVLGLVLLVFFVFSVSLVFLERKRGWKGKGVKQTDGVLGAGRVGGKVLGGYLGFWVDWSRGRRRGRPS